MHVHVYSSVRMCREANSLSGVYLLNRLVDVYISMYIMYVNIILAYIVHVYTTFVQVYISIHVHVYTLFVYTS